MRCIGAQEGRYVSGARQLVEATFFDGLEMLMTNAQAFLDLGKTKASRFPLVAQQTTNRAAR